MQTKQKSLLEQVEALDEECEELQRQLEERRDTQVQLEEELQRTTDEKERLQVQLNKQQVAPPSSIDVTNIWVGFR